ncbi:MAG: hypothetical protein LBB41_05315 [Prevotellaceae bacterium]|jgi:hypothetical protein|nr:hypothetical protein [Prevotellaceae bacterium]
MQKVLIILIILISVSGFGKKIYTEKVFSKNLNPEREFLVHTPVEFDENPQQRFDIMYVFDSQAREYFDFIHSVIPFCINRPFIVVEIISPFDAEKTKSEYGFFA